MPIFRIRNVAVHPVVFSSTFCEEIPDIQGILWTESLLLTAKTRSLEGKGPVMKLVSKSWRRYARNKKNMGLIPLTKAPLWQVRSNLNTICDLVKFSYCWFYVVTDVPVKPSSEITEGPGSDGDIESEADIDSDEYCGTHDSAPPVQGSFAFDTRDAVSYDDPDCLDIDCDASDLA